MGFDNMEYAVEVEGLSKFYGKENFQALKSINLKIKPNQIFGVLGSNGAGKTTFLSILSTTLSAEQGSVKIFGHDISKEKRKVRALINICSGYGGLWHELTIWENLIYYGKMYKITNYKEKAEDLLKMVDLNEKKKTMVSDLSTGMRQRLSIAVSLLSEPKLLLLDEPTVGLDPKVASKIRKRLLALQRKTQMTILLTTHNMYEAEYLCKNIALLKKGKILAVDPVEQLKKFLGNHQIIEVQTEKPLPALSVTGVTGIERKKDKTIIHVENTEKNLTGILKKIKKYNIKKIVVREMSLEELYVESM